MNGFAIGGVVVAVLVLGIVEALKEFGVTGKGSQVAAMVAGFVLVGTAQAIEQNLIPPEAVIYVELVVVSIAGALAAMGFYDFTKKAGL